VDERSTNSAALEAGMDGKWGESSGAYVAAGGFDGQWRVEDMAGEAAAGFGYQFQATVPARAEPFDQIGFVAPVESALEEVADFRKVFRQGGAKGDHGVS
jgi:hypothetical protein